MTYREIEEKLLASSIDNARAEALMLAAHAAHTDEQQLRPFPDREIPDPDGWLAGAVARRLSHEPLQYILGVWYFWRQEYEVSPDCLVPRADTERLLEVALGLLPRGGRFLDLCTGSGCIAVSLLCERQDATAAAVELYPNTLALAQRNAVKNSVSPERLTLLQGDVLTGDFLAPLGTFDVIVSNPPYIPTQDIAALSPEVHCEPIAALDGGEDGLLFYRRILLGADYRAALRRGGAFCFEIGYDQGAALRALAEEIGAKCSILKDYGGCDRVAVVQPREA